jgi:hypothetical protein
MADSKTSFRGRGNAHSRVSAQGYPLRRELIVIAKPEAQLRARAEGVTSLSGMDTTPIANLLKTEGASMRPLFGSSEDRIKAETVSMAASAGQKGPDLAVY